MNVATSCFRSALLLSLLSITVLYPGTTGKIAGKITDEKTGEAVVGATVLLTGTSTGAATDIDGSFIIPNLSPGSYSVSISAIGFRKKIVHNVRVNVDLTTRVNEQLSSESVDMEAVIVSADKPLVRRDLTSTQSNVDAEQIRSLPVESISAILLTQAGIVQDADDGLHFRGGRSHEVSYTVNGISINNPFTNANSFSIATNAIQELSVVQGTFNAEYGNALSGVVETGLKEGGEQYSGQISFYSGDRLSTHDNIFLNVKDFDPASHSVIEGTFGGPLPVTPEGFPVSFFLSGRFDHEQGWLYGVREFLPSDRPDFSNALRWKVPTSGNDELVPMNPRKAYTMTNRIGMKLSGTSKLGYDFIFNESRYQNYRHLFKYNPDGRLNYFENDVLHSLEYSDVYLENTMLRIKAAYGRNIYEEYRFKDLRPDHYEPSENLKQPIGTTFYFGGSQNDRFEQQAETYSAKIDLSTGYFTNHDIKSGIEVRFPQMKQTAYSVLLDTVAILVPTIPPPINYNFNSYARFPEQYSFYIQDKLEYESIVMNIGIRYDYFSANAKYIADVYEPEGAKAIASAKTMISPRLGASFPITDRGIIHFSYGHFYQMPQLRRLYANPDFKTNPTYSETIFGNADLRPELTVTYELGLQQQLSDNLAFTLTGFFKDVRDLFAVQRVRISGEKSFSMYVNKDYGNIKGFTVALTKRRTASDLFALSLDYSLLTAEGNDVSADAFFLDQQSGRQSELVVVPLDWDQQHTINGTITIGEPDLWNIGIISRLGTGLPYTPYVADNQVQLERNAGRKPLQYTTDMFIDRTIAFGDLSMTLFIKVYNLFDQLNEENVFEDTGRSTYTLAGKRGEGAVMDKNYGTVPGVHNMADYYNNPANYSSPREVRFGASLNF